MIYITRVTDFYPNAGIVCAVPLFHKTIAMKTILVPTDFSATADTAFYYALTLASSLKSRIVLLHAYQVPVPVAEVPFGVLNEEKQALKAESNARLDAMVLKIRHAGDIPYECISEGGAAVDIILEAAKEKQPDLIVMGATGESGLVEAILGSTSLKVMEKAKCPVMAVPAGLVISKPIKRITYATDYHQSDLAAIKAATEIAGASGAQLNILHISDAIIGADEEKTMMRHFMEKVKDISTYPGLSFEIIHGDDVETRLEQYIEDGSADMLMMSTHYRTFFDRLFGKSTTKAVARNAGIPVVAFHYNTKTAVNVY